ncbi:hypothetical protein KC622_03200 [Candidatus Dojkabacteria bacterium]|uniref:Cohesin domain-containing protein n=1 Tax=Candidatus Dojkabacteria bacterium TaxID=2099670 RepID=A0A955HYE1_9BACT|nr:hypothetical protein [Candidatus Dojkabacteria bacterium]
MIKRAAKLFISIGIFFLLGTACVNAVSAAEFTFNPDGGYVLEGDQFILDILIDTGGLKVTKARAVVTFDPTLVEIVKAERQNTLFSQYPDDEQSTDNTNGVLMLSGFTQSGTDSLYSTSGNPDVFARVTFKAIRDGAVSFNWEYTGSDAPFKTVIMADGSPPQNVLDSKPDSASFTIQDTNGTSTGSTTGTTTTGSTGKSDVSIPNTGVFDEKNIYIGLGIIVGGVLIYAGSSILYNASRNAIRSRQRTVVEYD